MLYCKIVFFIDCLNKLLINIFIKWQLTIINWFSMNDVRRRRDDKSELDIHCMTRIFVFGQTRKIFFENYTIVFFLVSAARQIPGVVLACLFFSSFNQFWSSKYILQICLDLLENKFIIIQLHRQWVLPVFRIFNSCWDGRWLGCFCFFVSKAILRKSLFLAFNVCFLNAILTFILLAKTIFSCCCCCGSWWPPRK